MQLGAKSFALANYAMGMVSLIREDECRFGYEFAERPLQFQLEWLRLHGSGGASFGGGVHVNAAGEKVVIPPEGSH